MLVPSVLPSLGLANGVSQPFSESLSQPTFVGLRLPLSVVSAGTEWLAILVLAVLVLAIAARLAYHLLSHPDTWRQGFLTVALRAFCTTRFSQRVRHTSTVPAQGGALVVANHRSPTDPLIMHTAASFQPTGRSQRVVEWITAREYVEIGGPIEWICRAAFSIPVDRGGSDMAAVKEALKRLKGGRIIGIFPEGRINVGVGLLEFNPGLAFLATRGGVPVIPTYIEDAPGGEAMQTMVQPFLSTTTARVHFGTPLDYTHLRRPNEEQRDEIVNEIREAIIALMPPHKRLDTRQRDLTFAAERAAAEAETADRQATKPQTAAAAKSN